MTDAENLLDVTVLENDAQTVGAVVMDDEKKTDYQGVKIDVEYLSAMVSMAESLDWDSAWLGVQSETLPVIMEPTGDHGPGSLVLCPIMPPEDDGGEDDGE